MAVEKKRLFIKITREYLPQHSDRHPFIYLERGRLEVDDSSIKWIDCDGNIVPIPVALIGTLLLGPGVSVTHEAIKVLAASNCFAAWVGEDSLLFYAAGFIPTANTYNLNRQIQLYADESSRLEVAKRMFKERFPGVDLKNKNLPMLMGMEGGRIKALYIRMAKKYQIAWKGRRFIPGKFESSDMTNKCITACNTALYAIICACLHAMGFSPRIGFIHSGSPLPFAYDIADLYKEYYCIDLAFSLTHELNGHYQREKVREAFLNRVIEGDLIKNITLDVMRVLGLKDACTYCK